MAAKKEAGAAKRPQPLSQVELGRMIIRLRSYQKQTGWWPRRHDKWWNDNEIMQEMGLSKKQFDAALESHRLVGRPGRAWTERTAREAFNSYVHREKRWPTEKDLRNWRETGLPTRSSLNLWLGGMWDAIDRYARTYESKLTTEMIFSIPNLTVRRDVMSRIGIEKIIKKGGGTRIQQDDFGTLWRLPTIGADPHLQYVEVVNTTPVWDHKLKKVKTDRNGNEVFDHYFLCVPHSVRTAKEGVAWGLNVPVEQFAGFTAQS